MMYCVVYWHNLHIYHIYLFFSYCFVDTFMDIVFAHFYWHFSVYGGRAPNWFLGCFVSDN